MINFENVTEVTKPIPFALWANLADQLDEDWGIGGNRYLKVGYYVISIVAFPGGHALPEHDDIALPLREYTHVEVAIFHDNGNQAITNNISQVVAENIGCHFDDGGNSAGEVASFVDVSLLPIWINLLLKEPRGYFHVPAEDVPDIIAHFKSVVNGSYSLGGPGTSTYFSFAK